MSVAKLSKRGWRKTGKWHARGRRCRRRRRRRQRCLPEPRGPETRANHSHPLAFLQTMFATTFAFWDQRQPRRQQQQQRRRRRQRRR